MGTAPPSLLSTLITQKKDPLRIKILSGKLSYFWININVSHFFKIRVREKLCCY